MGRFSKLLLAFTLIATPLVFTSCDDNDDYYYYNDPVAEAVKNYWYTFPGGADYLTSYNWFLYYYPYASASEFDAFLNAINKGGTPYWNLYNNGGYGWNDNYNDETNTQNAKLLEEAQTLCGEWEGSMIYEYTDDNTGQRVQDTFTANMKFFQYNSSVNSLSGNGVEIDTDDKGNSQTLNFEWYVNTNGDIYIKYTASGTIFVMDIDSSTNGFKLGYDKEKGYDTFYGVGISSNTSDVFYIDLARQATNAKGTTMTRARKAAGKLEGKSFGQATENKAAEYKTTAINRLHKR